MSTMIACCEKCNNHSFAGSTNIYSCRTVMQHAILYKMVLHNGRHNGLIPRHTKSLSQFQETDFSILIVSTSIVC